MGRIVVDVCSPQDAFGSRVGIASTFDRPIPPVCCTVRGFWGCRRNERFRHNEDRDLSDHRRPNHSIRPQPKHSNGGADRSHSGGRPQGSKFMMIRLRLISSIFMAILLMCSVRADVTPTAKPAPPAGGTQSAQAQSTPPYQLQAGDVIEIRLFYNPELNEQVQIRPDGRVSLQLIGEVELASKTVSGAIAELR